MFNFKQIGKSLVQLFQLFHTDDSDRFHVEGVFYPDCLFEQTRKELLHKSTSQRMLKSLISTILFFFYNSLCDVREDTSNLFTKVENDHDYLGNLFKKTCSGLMISRKNECKNSILTARDIKAYLFFILACRVREHLILIEGKFV